MRVPTGVGHDGVALQVAAPGRAIVLAVASRTVLGLLAVGGLAVLSLPLWPASGGTAPEVVPGAPTGAGTAVDLLVAAPQAGGALGLTMAGLTMAGLVSGVTRETQGVGATLVELDVIAEAGAGARVLLRIDTPGGDAASVARVLVALDRAQLTAPRVRTVTPVPAGARLELTATVVRATAPLTSPLDAPARQTLGPDAAGGADLSVALTELVQRSGAELRRLEVRDVDGPDGRSIRLAARADVAALVDLLDALERTHTAPLRFTTLRVEASGDARSDLTAVFVLRDVAPSTVTAITP